MYFFVYALIFMSCLELSAKNDNLCITHEMLEKFMNKILENNKDINENNYEWKIKKYIIAIIDTLLRNQGYCKLDENSKEWNINVTDTTFICLSEYYEYKYVIVITEPINKRHVSTIADTLSKLYYRNVDLHEKFSYLTYEDRYRNSMNKLNSLKYKYRTFYGYFFESICFQILQLIIQKYDSINDVINSYEYFPNEKDAIIINAIIFLRKSQLYENNDNDMNEFINIITTAEYKGYLYDYLSKCKNDITEYMKKLITHIHRFSKHFEFVNIIHNLDLSCNNVKAECDYLLKIINTDTHKYVNVLIESKCYYDIKDNDEVYFMYQTMGYKIQHYRKFNEKTDIISIINPLNKNGYFGYCNIDPYNNCYNNVKYNLEKYFDAE